MTSARSLGWRLVGHGLASAVLGLGVAGVIDAGLGVAPYDVLITGVAETADITPGVSGIACGLTLMMIGVVLGRRPGIGTIVATVVVGVFIDVGLGLFSTPDVVALQIAMAFAAALATLVGITGTVVSNTGEGPIELLMIGLSDRMGISVARARITIEISAVGVGWLLGGEVGVVTVIYAFTLGPALRRTLHVVEARGA